MAIVIVECIANNRLRMCVRKSRDVRMKCYEFALKTSTVASNTHALHLQTQYLNGHLIISICVHEYRCIHSSSLSRKKTPFPIGRSWLHLIAGNFKFVLKMTTDHCNSTILFLHFVPSLIALLSKHNCDEFSFNFDEKTILKQKSHFHTDLNWIKHCTFTLDDFECVRCCCTFRTNNYDNVSIGNRLGAYL